jgi:hypothetical protein
MEEGRRRIACKLSPEKGKLTRLFRVGIALFALLNLTIISLYISRVPAHTQSSEGRQQTFTEASHILEFCVDGEKIPAKFLGISMSVHGSSKDPSTGVCCRLVPEGDWSLAIHPNLSSTSLKISFRKRHSEDCRDSLKGTTKYFPRSTLEHDRTTQM